MQAHLLSLAMQPEPAVPARVSGACALVAYLVGESLTVAGAGDCRAVIASEADGTVCSTDLSTDHKLDLPAELARLQAAGAYVEPAQGSEADHNYAPGAAPSPSPPPPLRLPSAPPLLSPLTHT